MPPSFAGSARGTSTRRCTLLQSRAQRTHQTARSGRRRRRARRWRSRPRRPRTVPPLPSPRRRSRGTAAASSPMSPPASARAPSSASSGIGSSTARPLAASRVTGRWNSPALVPFRQRLELHRRLPLVERALPHAEHRRGRVEEPAHRARQRRVERARDLRRRRSPAPAPGSPRNASAKCSAHCRRERQVAGARRATAGGSPRRRPGSGRVPELRDPLVARQVGHQDLGAPHAAVVAVAGAVERDAEHPLRHAVLGHHRRDVRVVVLHHDRTPAPPPRRRRVREIGGVHVAHDDLGRDAGRARFWCAQRRPEVLERLEVVEVADVLADVGGRAVDERERVLEMRPDREQRHRARDWERTAAAARSRAHAGGTPARRRSSRRTESSTRAAIPRSCRRKASAMSPSRSSASSALAAIGSSLRLPLVMTSGRAVALEQQMVQRRVGEHHADPAEPGRDAGGDRRTGAARERARSAARATVSSAASASLTTARRRAPRRGTGPSPRTASRRGACGVRSRRTALSFVASTARWKPPTPRTATIDPARSAAAAAAQRVRPRSRRSRPARSARQRQRGARTPGRSSSRCGGGGRPASRTRRGRSAHWVKARIVVRSRSYGSASITV